MSPIYENELIFGNGLLSTTKSTKQLHNIVNQLYFNKTLKNEKKIRKTKNPKQSKTSDSLVNPFPLPLLPDAETTHKAIKKELSLGFM